MVFTITGQKITNRGQFLFVCQDVGGVDLFCCPIFRILIHILQQSFLFFSYFLLYLERQHSTNQIIEQIRIFSAVKTVAKFVDVGVQILFADFVELSNDTAL